MVKASKLTKEKGPTRSVSTSEVRRTLNTGKIVRGWKFSSNSIKA